jgi:hypothetical protein
MQYLQSKNDRHRWMPYQISIRMLIVLLAGLFVGQPTMAQTKEFKATPLAPDGTISAPKDARSKGALRGESATLVQKSLLQPTVATGFCDVTISPGTSPAGYLALSLFGIAPVPGVTDESVTDFTVPAFTFAGETYTRVGFSSNGYVVIGGTTGPADNSRNNQNFPNSTLPNNVLAPFWTDLNPAAAGALRIATLTDGVDTWIVLDWAGVREFSTANSNSFEVWIGVNNDTNPAEDITFAYGPIGGSGDLGLLTVGAENKLGTRGQNFRFNGTGTLPAAGTELRVTTTSCASPEAWTAAGSTGAVDEDSAAIVELKNSVATLQPGATGTVSIRYNITVTRGLAFYCPATQSVIKVRFRNSDNTGTNAQVKFEIHRASVAAGGNATIFAFNSNGRGAGNAFTSASFSPNIDFDFSTNLYWIEATVFRADAAQFADLGSISIYESAGTPCP